MLNNLDMKGRVQWEVDLEDIEKEEYLKRSMIYHRKETVEKLSLETPFMRCKDLDLLDLGATIKTYANSIEHLYDPQDFFTFLSNVNLEGTDKKKRNRMIYKLISKETMYHVKTINEEGREEFRTLIDSDGAVYMLLKAQDFNYPHAELLARAFARTINVFRSFMGISLSDYIASAVSCRAIKPMGELPVGNFLPHTDKIKFRFVSEYVLDKNNKVLLGDEENVLERLEGSRKARKYMFYIDTSDNTIQQILTNLYPDVLLEEIDKVLARYVDQAKFKFRAASNYGRVFITDKMLYDLVTYCAGGYTSMKPLVDEMIKVYGMDKDDSQIFVDSFITLHDFDYECDVTFFDKYNEIINHYGLE